MSHHVYTTEAFVLDSGPGREADKIYWLFTKELGMIRASAQGVRLQKSKLRFSLQDFSYITVSVVRGKEWWRVTNAVPEKNIFTDYKDRKYIVYAFARIFRLLRRLIPEQDKHETIFSTLIEAVQFVEQQSLDAKSTQILEYILALRIVHALGYIGAVPTLESFISSPLTKEMLEKGAGHSKEFVSVINASIRESHL
jgi:DNA repair protein RecO